MSTSSIDRFQNTRFHDFSMKNQVFHAFTPMHVVRRACGHFSVLSKSSMQMSASSIDLVSVRCQPLLTTAKSFPNEFEAEPESTLTDGTLQKP